MLTKTPMQRSNIEIINGIKIGKRVKDKFYDNFDKDTLVGLKTKYGRDVVLNAWNNETFEEFLDIFDLVITKE